MGFEPTDNWRTLPLAEGAFNEILDFLGAPKQFPWSEEGAATFVHWEGVFFWWEPDDKWVSAPVAHPVWQCPALAASRPPAEA